MNILKNEMKTLKAVLLSVVFFSTVPMAAERPIEEYLADLSSQDNHVQIEACRYLGEKKEVAAVESLLFLLEDKDEDIGPHVKAASANALASIGNQAGVSDALLLSARESKYASVRYASFWALLSLKDEEKEADIKELVQEMKSSSDLYLRDLAQKIASEYEKKQQK